MQIITVLSSAMDMARRNFTRGEQSMLIDIFNGMALTPGILGQHLTVQIEDSFYLYPGQYEEKWGVNRLEMYDKIKALSALDAIFLELWAVGFWALGDGSLLDSYLSGKTNLAVRLTEIMTRLETSAEMLEKTKGSFKSAAVAEAREIVKEASEILGGMI